MSRRLRHKPEGRPEGRSLILRFGARDKPPVAFSVLRYSISEVKSCTESPAARPGGIIDWGMWFSSATSTRFSFVTCPAILRSSTTPSASPVTKPMWATPSFILNMEVWNPWATTLFGSRMDSIR